MKIRYLLLVILFYTQFHYINELVLHLCSTYDFLGCKKRKVSTEVGDIIRSYLTYF